MAKKNVKLEFPVEVIQEMTSLEGKKSQVSYGNMCEIFARLADIMINPTGKGRKLRRKMEKYFSNKHLDTYGVPCDFDFDPMMDNYTQCQAVEKAHRYVQKEKRK